MDGYFWHGFNWEERKRKFKTNSRFWIPKIERNMQRDSEQNAQLEEMGFVVMRFWESELKNKFEDCLDEVVEKIVFLESNRNERYNN